MPDKNHHYSDEMISAYLDDELTLEERQQVEQWLSVDLDARELMMQLGQLRDQLRGGLQQPVPPLDPSFAARVLSRISESQLEADSESLPEAEDDAPGSAARDTGAADQEVARKRTRFEPGWRRGFIWATGIVAASIALLLSQQFYPRSEQQLAQYDSPASDKAADDAAADDAVGSNAVGGNAAGRGGSPGNSRPDNAIPGDVPAVDELLDNDAAAADAPASFAAKGGGMGGAAERAKEMTAADHLEINEAAVRRDALPSRSRQFAAPALDVDAANQALSQALPDDAILLPPPAPVTAGATAGATAAAQDGFERSELRDSRDLASVSLQRQVVQAQITRDQLPSVANQLTADHHDFYQLPDNQRNDLAANVVSESVGNTQRRLVVPEATSPTPDVVQVFVDGDADAVISSLQKLPNVNWTVLPSDEWLRQTIPEVTQVQQSLQTKVGRRPPVLLMLQLQDPLPNAADVEHDPAR